MADFTVIEGGGQRRDWDREIAQQHFESFVVVLLRSLASGDGGYRLSEAFFRFLEHAQKTGVPVGPVLDGAVKRLCEDAFDAKGDDYDADKKYVLETALMVIAESMASDNLARARKSKREGDFRQAIEEFVIGRERRSRENGWSYLSRATESLGKWPPPRATLKPLAGTSPGRRGPKPKGD